jgi:hypothetical protein
MSMGLQTAENVIDLRDSIAHYLDEVILLVQRDLSKVEGASKEYDKPGARRLRHLARKLRAMASLLGAQRSELRTLVARIQEAARVPAVGDDVPVAPESSRRSGPGSGCARRSRKGWSDLLARADLPVPYDLTRSAAE